MPICEDSYVKVEMKIDNVMKHHQNTKIITNVQQVPTPG